MLVYLIEHKFIADEKAADVNEIKGEFAATKKLI
jgi:hypothetical protein